MAEYFRQRAVVAAAVVGVAGVFALLYILDQKGLLP